MNLSFKTSIDNKPTHFVEKIRKSLCLEENNFKAKKHTIRADEKDLWKVGRNIHFIINNRTSNRKQFAPLTPVISTQKIEMNNRFGYSSFEVLIDGKIFAQRHYGNDKDVNYQGLEELAINDGFDCVADFVKYFESQMINGIFKGKLIHWTDILY